VAEQGRSAGESGPGEAAHADEQIDAALEALTDAERLGRAQERVAALAPQLQHILLQALREGGWFDAAETAQVRKAATAADVDERTAMIRTLLAEETRLGMLVGVAVGWELARELDRDPPNR